jgi:hypothetical protein
VEINCNVPRFHVHVAHICVPCWSKQAQKYENEEITLDGT